MRITSHDRMFWLQKKMPAVLRDPKIDGPDYYDGIDMVVNGHDATFKVRYMQPHNTLVLLRAVRRREMISMSEYLKDLIERQSISPRINDHVKWSLRWLRRMYGVR